LTRAAAGLAPCAGSPLAHADVKSISSRPAPGMLAPQLKTT